MDKNVIQELFPQRLPANNLRSEKYFLNQFLKVILTVSFLIVLLFLPMIAEGDSNGNIIYVNTTGWWKKDGEFHQSSTPIQSAIDSATAGDTIIVANGTYNEHIVIDKPLTLLGAQANVDPTVKGARTDPSNESIIIGTGGGYDGAAIVIELSEATDEPEVIINGFTIKNPGGDYGIVLPSSPASPPYKDAIVEYNIITECRFGIESLYGEAAGSVIRKNLIVNNTYYGIDCYPWYTTIALVIEKNKFVDNEVGIYMGYTQNFSIIGNNFTGNDYGIYIYYDDGSEVHYNNIIGNLEYGIYIYSKGLPTINASLNYWGDSTGPYHPTTNPCATGENVSDYVVYTPWLNAPYPGGQAKSFNVFIDSNKNGQYDAGEPAFNCIQSATNSASDGDTIVVDDGVYNEQIIVNKILTIQGQGDATIIKPSQDTANNFQLFSRKVGGSANTAAIVVVNANATIKNLKIDGSEIISVPSGATLVGILYRGVNGTIDSVTIDNINISSGIGGNAIYISSMGKDSNVEVKGCTISNFYKNGITANYEGLTVNIHDNNITGSGPLSNVAQNGIQIGFGATGSVVRNTVSEIVYTGENYEACGILFLDSSGTATDNTIINCQAGIIAQAGWYPPVTSNVTIENNTINATGLTGLSYVAGTGAVTWDENAVITITIKSNNLIGAGYGEGISLGGEPEYNPTGTVNAAIEGNNISNWGHGIWIGPPSKQIVITGNNILNNVEVDSGIHITDVDVSDIKINFNNIEGNAAYGIYNNGIGTLNATYNYWGNTTGPYHATLNPDGGGENVSDNVEFTPWLDAPYPEGQPYADIFIDSNENGQYDEGEPAFYSIQEAIDNANNGDTIKVYDGVYYENLVIDKEITLQSDSTPIINGNQTAPCITIKADNVVVDGFILFNGTYGIYMNDGGESYNLTIRNCIIKNNTEWGAVYLRQNNANKNVTVLVENNVFEWNGGDNLVIKDEAYTQAHPDGFYGYRWIIRNNTFNPCGSPNWDYSGLGFEPALGVLVENNIFNTYWGIWMDNARYIMIRNNTLSYSLGEGGAGIVVWGDDNPVVTKYVTIENNEIHGFKSNNWTPEDGKGIVIGGAENVTIRNNRIYGNNIGIWLNNSFINCNEYEINNPNPNWIESVKIHFNNIENNTEYGVQNLFTSMDVDAKYNYWGHPSGPNATDNPNGLGDRVSDNVIYWPYYIDAAMTVLSTESQIMLNETTEVNETQTEIIIPPNNPSANITVPSNVTNATLNLAPILSKTNETAYATLTGSLNINTSTPIGNVLIQIPSNVTISGNVAWNGTINLPRFKGTTPSVPLSSLPVSAGYTPTVTSVIEIGFGDVELIFDKAVRILLPGKAGQKVGYSRGGTFREITTVCYEDSQNAGNGLPVGGDCKIDVGSDLVIWTKHFTEFVTYTESPIPTPTPTGGGGAGPVRYLRIDIISADTAITQTANTSQTYEVEVRNLGTVTANISLTISDLPSTYYTISLPSITLESHETGILSYTLNLPADAESTTFKVTLNAVSGRLTDSKTYEVELTVIPPTVITQQINVTVPRNVTQNVTVPVVPVIGVPVATITGRFIAIISQPSTQLAIGLIISVIVLIVIIRIVMERRKPWRTRYGLSYQERLTMNLKKQIKKVIGG